MSVRLWHFAVFLLFPPCVCSGQATGASSSWSAKFVTVEPGVKLEVLDYGGTGRPVVLLAGLGATAHSWTEFPTDLRAKYHVYAITRRGYPPSDVPSPSAENYNADQLGDDVLSVITQLKIEHPVLIGHSLAGEELSSVGSRYPDRVAGLVYLDAGYRYALSPPDAGDFQIDVITMRDRLNEVLEAISAADQQSAIDAVQRDLSDLEMDLSQRTKEIEATKPLSAQQLAAIRKESQLPESRIEQAILLNERRYTRITCPVLAIFAAPHKLHSGLTGKALLNAERRDEEFGQSRAAMFRALPNARVVILPHAEHAVFESNPEEVLGAIHQFIDTLQ